MKITNISVIQYETLFSVYVKTAHKGEAQICTEMLVKSSNSSVSPRHFSRHLPFMYIKTSDPKRKMYHLVKD